MNSRRLFRRFGRKSSLLGRCFLDLGIKQQGFFGSRLWLSEGLALHNVGRARSRPRSHPCASGASLSFRFRRTMSALFLFDQRLAVGNWDLIVIWMDFAKGQEAVTVATVVDEGRLQRGLYACDLGEIDISAQLSAMRQLEIKFLDPISAQHHHTGFLRVGRVDEHFVGH